MCQFRACLVAIFVALLSITPSGDVIACTGVTLKAKDGAVVYGARWNGARSISTRR